VSRFQFALNVDDLEGAVDLYSKILATEPAKKRPGYANFAVEDPPLKLVLFEDPDRSPGSVNHLGVEVDDPSAVQAAAERLEAEGLRTRREERVSCCFALQDKVWVEGPAGQPWEIYTVLADEDGSPACCRC
jgi:catechol 2,3-dioxygenase-like lactoylglutathione lyase family enzyme